MMQTPDFIYGTAWKKESTTALVKLAIASGFRAIDTANQAKHYAESLVGDAIVALKEKGLNREQLFLQTKFTPENGHDDKIPYDPNSDYETQVETSFKSSLEHLQTDYVDSYLLHGPYSWSGLSEADWRVWQAIENIYTSGKAKLIGVSNFNKKQLALLTSVAKVKPMVVQNRCFATLGWDKEVRELCNNNHIMYQGFSLLTANEAIIKNKKISALAKRLNKTPEQIIFRFSKQIGIVPLTGTTNQQHMQQDLQIFDFELTSDEVTEIENL